MKVPTNQALLIATLALIVSVVGHVPTLRQKTAYHPIKQFKAGLRWENQFEMIEPETGGTVLIDDPMTHNPPIPVESPTDIEVIIPPETTAPPVLVNELNIHIDGPADAMVGDMVKLHADITGKPSAIKWLIDPPVDDFITLDGGLRAVFSNRNVGVYHVVCSVAGNDGHVDVDTHSFEIVPQPPENPLTPNTISQLTPQLSVEELIKRWLAEVKSPNKLGEAHAIAGSFRNVASLLRSGTIPGPDLLRSVEQAGEIAIGPQFFKNWKPFFERTREFLLPLNASKTVFTPEQYANTFENIATVMETLSTDDSH